MPSPAVTFIVPDRIDAGDLSVAYFDLGDPHADPVVLLHGCPYDVHGYDRVAPLLAGSDGGGRAACGQASACTGAGGSPPVVNRSRGICRAGSETVSRPNSSPGSQDSSTRTLRSQVGTAST